jgi:Fe-Mn family superoxide dismutase
MLSAARTVLRPNTLLTRSLAARAASVHTLPPLPYAYNVCLYSKRNDSSYNFP